MANNPIEIEITGVAEVSALLEQLSVKTKNAIHASVAQAALFVQTETQASISGERAEPRSVDTGEFRDSVGIVLNDFSATVSSDVPQALFMEYGTSRITERRHFRNTAARSEVAVARLLHDGVVGAVK